MYLSLLQFYLKKKKKKEYFDSRPLFEIRVAELST